MEDWAKRIDIILEALKDTPYDEFTYQMEQLRDCCDEAIPFIKELTEEFRETYKRRPAFMKQLDRLN